MKKIYFTLLAFVLTFSCANAQKFKSAFHTNNWFEYIEGNIPLVITVPHGGKIRTDSLPTRTCKGAITTVDLYTIELAKEIQSYFIKNYKVSPYIVISHLARKHVDQNRDLDRSATCGNEKLHYAWYDYHNLIDTAISKANKLGKGVMFIDLHGHAHPKQRMELGYHLKADELLAITEGASEGKNHSLNNLLALNKKLAINDLLFGENAFGTLLHNRYVPSVPSKQDVAPLKDEAFFSTGPTTRRYTSSSYPSVFGFQLECNREVRFEKDKRINAAKAIAEAVKDYLNYTINYKF
jgi:hypothetical protein